MASTEFVFCYVTCPNEEVARKIAHICVEEKLAACANLVTGMRSIYIWEGKLQDEPETILILKTKESRFAEIQEAVLNHHQYDTPCIVALPVVKGFDKYLDWLRAGTK